MTKAMVPAGSPSTGATRPFELLGQDIETVCSDIAAATGTELELIQDAYPCSPLQVGLMSLSTTTAGSYIARHTLDMPTSLSIDRFKELWEMLVSSNDVLRTTTVDTAMRMARFKWSIAPVYNGSTAPTWRATCRPTRKRR